MPSEFDTAFAVSVLPDEFQSFGQPILLAPPGDVERQLTAVVSPESIEEILESANRVERRVRFAKVMRDPDGKYGGIYRPRIHSIVWIGEVDQFGYVQKGAADEYRVAQITALDTYTATMKLMRPEAMEVARHGFRTK